jgi:hypothetical protein
MRRILQADLNSPAKFREKMLDHIQSIREYVKTQSGINFTFEELGDTLLAACRANDLNLIDTQEKKRFLDEEKIQDWVDRKLMPNIKAVDLDDEDVIRLLLFCIEITYQMFAGGTKATVTQKGFRDRRRTFESILVDQFVGKFGEIITKKFLESSFSKKIDLDWEISRDIAKYRNDIVNSKKNVSIKSSPSLAGIWAEADIGYDYGITVKCFIPQPTILQFFIEVCGFTRLLDFADERIPQQDTLFKGYLGDMRERIRGYKSGEIQTELKGFVCGYFKTSDYIPVEEGENLSYLGQVREKRYLIQINELKYAKNDWHLFLQDVGLI